MLEIILHNNAETNLSIYFEKLHVIITEMR